MFEQKNKSMCCGCMACLHICPKECLSIKKDDLGFLYPFLENPDACIKCNACERVCQFIEKEVPQRPLKVYAAKNNNVKELAESSSGGIFILLAKQVINQGGIVFGAKFDKDFNVIHGYASEINGVKEFQGSKYLQSNIGNSLKQAESFLKDKKPVLFSGTECQILGLKKYLRKEYENLLTVSVLCHGTPSPKIWKEYIEYTGIKEIEKISFRNKSLSWNNYCMQISGRNGQLMESHNKNTYIKGFLSNVFLRPSCYNCVAKQGRSHSDIILGDFWGIENHFPDLNSDKLGVSLVLVNTKKGLNFLKKLAITSIETTFDVALTTNNVITQSVKRTKKADLFTILYKYLGFKKSIKIVLSIDFISKIGIKIKNRIIRTLKSKTKNNLSKKLSRK